ncbi:hypothetical protein [Methylobacterium isbiliense]|jgi:hypothetical protein|uniref:Uncharacterized protein n=1 Tax=Methylobacterium isbiliense TaxID=315478 RepID=A0ABQ4SK78_9HYPH|nr:hypothetical protein [Methylobacterium isbiliense]MDN3627521.1 hypothetical protein [Methylobacterium isbiliense]GJE03567.1 hypothetical protein GMJLKIPL_5524 [Methylobacterium isbiliense]
MTEADVATCRRALLGVHRLFKNAPTPLLDAYSRVEAPPIAAFVGRWAGRMMGDALKFDATNEWPLMA